MARKNESTSEHDQNTHAEMSGSADKVVQAGSVSGGVNIQQVGTGAALQGDIQGDLNLTFGRD